MKQTQFVLRDVFIAVKPKIGKKKNLFHFQKLEKEEQTKPKVNNNKL